MLKAVIFDLDGVLINSEPLMRVAFDVCYRQIIGEGDPPIEAFLEHMGESFPHIMDALNLPHTLWKPYREYCQQHIDHITLFAQSHAILTWVVAQNLKVALLTGKDYTRTIQILEHFDILPFFDVIVASDQLLHPKPAPDGVIAILVQLGYSANEAIMIGDAVSDILCAQRAGVPAMAVTWGIKPECVQTLCRPEYIAHRGDELLQILATLCNADSALRI